jgi:hypothetical protein
MTQKTMIVVFIVGGILLLLLFMPKDIFRKEAENSKAKDSLKNAVKDSTKESGLATKIFQPEITYSTSTNNPYDVKFAFEAFKNKTSKGYVFNEAAINMKNSRTKETDNLWVIISPYFMPNDIEVNNLWSLAAQGNNVFISSFQFSPNFLRFILRGRLNDDVCNNFPPQSLKDSLKVTWRDPETNQTTNYSYPGINTLCASGTDFVEDLEVNTLLFDSNGEPQLIDIKISSGHIFVLFNPITLSNYFLLHKQNYTYLNHIFEVIDLKNRKVIWDNHYKNVSWEQNQASAGHNRNRGAKTATNNDENSLWQLIKNTPSLAWAIGTFFLGIFLFLLLFSRRVQTPVEVLAEVKNNSMEFVKAVSGLYWLKQDHKKIAEKIILQFYDHLLVKFKFMPKDITLENTLKISQKTNKSASEIADIITYIQHVEKRRQIEKNILVDLYKKVHSFIYQSKTNTNS